MQQSHRDALIWLYGAVRAARAALDTAQIPGILVEADPDVRVIESEANRLDTEPAKLATRIARKVDL